MKPNISHKEFLNKLPKDREYEIIGEHKNATSKILVKDKYGYCESLPYTLLTCSKVSILTAINPTKYCINKFKEVHGDCYLYENFIYTNNITKSIITCPKHGDFEQSPQGHLQGRGCRKCSIIKNSKKRVYSINNFIEKSNKVHNNFYNYEDSIYVNKRTKISIICPLHSNFLQVAGAHLSGSGCPKCASETVGGYSRGDSIKTAKGKECTFYILKCWNEKESFYKIGITSNTVNKRFVGKRNMPYNYEILQEIKGEAGEIWDLELKNKRLLRGKKYNPLINFRGYTECFSNIQV